MQMHLLAFVYVVNILYALHANVVTLADPINSSIITQSSMFVELVSLFQSRCLDAFLLHCSDIVVFSSI